MRFLSDDSYGALILVAKELNKSKATHLQAEGMFIVLKELDSTDEVDYHDGDEDADMPPNLN